MFGSQKSTHGSLIGDPREVERFEGGSDTHYIPFSVARKKIAAMGRQMELMKQDHLSIIKRLKKHFNSDLKAIRVEDNNRIAMIKDGATKKILELKKVLEEQKYELTRIKEAEESLRKQQLREANDVRVALQQHKDLEIKNLREKHVEEKTKLEQKRVEEKTKIEQEHVEQKTKLEQDLTEKLNGEAYDLVKAAEDKVEDRILDAKQDFEDEVEEKEKEFEEQLKELQEKLEEKEAEMKEGLEKMMTEKDEELKQKLEEKDKYFEEIKSKILANKPSVVVMKEADSGAPVKDTDAGSLVQVQPMEDSAPVAMAAPQSGIPSAWQEEKKQLSKEKDKLAFTNKMLEQQIKEIKEQKFSGGEGTENVRSPEDITTIEEQSTKLVEQSEKLAEQAKLLAEASKKENEASAQAEAQSEKVRNTAFKNIDLNKKLQEMEKAAREKELGAQMLKTSVERLEEKVKEGQRKLEDAIDEKESAVKRMEDVQKIMDMTQDVPEAVAESQKQVRLLERQQTELKAKLAAQADELAREREANKENQQLMLEQKDKLKEEFNKKNAEYKAMRKSLKSKKGLSTAEKKDSMKLIKEREKEIKTLQQDYKDIRMKLKAQKAEADAAKKKAEQTQKDAEEEKKKMEGMLKEHQETVAKAVSEAQAEADAQAGEIKEGETSKKPKVNPLAALLLAEKDNVRKLELRQKKLKRTADDAKASVIEIKKKLERAKDESKKLSKVIEAKDAELSELRAKPQADPKELGELKDKLKGKQLELQKANAEAGDAKAAAAKAEAELAKAQKSLGTARKAAAMAQAEAGRASAIAQGGMKAQEEVKALKAQIEELKTKQPGDGAAAASVVVKPVEVKSTVAPEEVKKLKAQIAQLQAQIKSGVGTLPTVTPVPVEAAPVAAAPAGGNNELQKAHAKLAAEKNKLAAEKKLLEDSLESLKNSSGEGVAKLQTELVESKKDGASKGKKIEDLENQLKDRENQLKESTAKLEASIKGSSEAYENELKALKEDNEKKLTEIQAKLGDSSKLAEKFEEEKKKVADALSQSQEQCVKLKSEYGELEAKSKNAIAECEEMRGKVKGLEDTIQDQENSVKEAKEEAKRWEGLAQHNARAVLEEAQMRRKLQIELMQYKGNIRVFCRVRPFSRNEKATQAVNCVRTGINDWTLQLNDPKKDLNGKISDLWKDFSFDHVFPNFPENKGNQKAVFEDTKIYAEIAMGGQNACIFAYGQSGTGKTWTMSGIKDDVKNEGIKPRMFRELFQCQETQKMAYSYQFKVQMIEIYGQKKKQQLRDLFYLMDENRKSKKAASSKAPTAFPTYKGPALKILCQQKKSGKNSKKKVQIIGAQMVEFDTYEDMIETCTNAEKCRFVRATGLNDESSRSHLISIVHIKSTNKKTNKTTNGKLTLVDLAGSEKAEKTAMAEDLSKKQREAMIAEGVSINQSLGMLRNLFLTLSSGDKKAKPQYRGNYLTELLQDSIGGGAKTLMFVNVGPAARNRAESMDSMKYAEYAKNVVNEIEGEDADLAAQNKELERRVANLEKQLAGG